MSDGSLRAALAPDAAAGSAEGIAFPAELPITAELPALTTAIRDHQVTVLCGATGSGKSTQTPKLCLELGRGVAGRIGHTQPRRIAARSIALRIAAELRVDIGSIIGYQTRFDRRVGAATRVKVMTDGVLLHEIHHDRLLEAYDTLIIDEVHERSLNIDFLIGYLRKILPLRADLRIVLTSATIEAERFCTFFEDAACVEIPGKAHPIEVRYRPPDPQEDPDLNQALLAAIAELDADARGDILVFLPGEREINEAREAIEGARLRDTAVLALYARLGSRDQQRVFEPHRQRHIILATNVAETSLTVPAVRHVIDSGLARISSYSARSKLQRLPVAKVSRASAEQRKGRCGRERDGICVRLYSEPDFAQRPAHTPPELLRTNLAGVILKLADLELGMIDGFPFLDPPDPRAINDGYSLLRDLGAMDGARRVLPEGHLIAKLPLDPRLGKMVVAAAAAGSLREVLVIVSALSVTDIRERPLAARAAADAAHAAFADRRSDFLWYLNAWAFLTQEFRGASRRRQAAICREAFWSVRRVREWLDVYAQLVELAGALKLAMNDTPAGYRAIHLALLGGLVNRVGRLEDQGEYLGCRNQRFRLHPGSALRARPPRWVVAAEITETSAHFARRAARVEPAWIVAVAPALIKRSYSAPVWDPERGQAVTLEDQTLYGLMLASGRRVDLAPIQPAEARAIFITTALVRGELGADLGFLAHNRALVAEVRAAEERVRRRDLLADEAVLAAFYAERLPSGVNSRKTLLAWLRTRPERDATLCMTQATVTREGIESLPDYLFPAALEVAGMRLPLRYRFEPGAVDDGVTVQLPLPLLEQLPNGCCERLVPGMLRDKIFALLKRLPKEWRRGVSPLNEFASALTAAIEPQPGALAECLTDGIARMTGIRIPVAAWRAADLPDHLKMRFAVVETDQRELATGRDLAALRAACAQAACRAFDRTDWQIAGRSTRGWPFARLPAEIIRTASGVAVRGHPALVAGAGEVTVGVFASAADADAAHQAGVTALLALSSPREVKYLRRHIPQYQRLSLQAQRLGLPGSLDQELVRIAFARSLAGRVLPRDEAAFADLLVAARREVAANLNRLVADVESIFELASAVQSAVHTQLASAWPAVAADIGEQLADLIYPGFLGDAEATILAHYPRQLRAIGIRLERHALDPQKDARKFAALTPVLARYREARATWPTGSPVLRRVRFLLQEYRVAVFAPELGTAEAVSERRLLALLRGLNAS